MAKAKCGIYENRPDVCKDYPTKYHYTPLECTFIFPNGESRGGECDCGTSACCAIPREKGEPGGAPIPEEAGGEPCKHIVWEEEPMSKEAAANIEKNKKPKFGTLDLMKELGQDVFD